MIEGLLGGLRTPFAGFDGLTVDLAHALRRAGDGSLESATLVGPEGSDPSLVRGGIWDAIGDGTPPRTLAQISNVLPPVPQLYEALWRVRSLTLLSGHDFPIAAELAELDTALGEVEGSVALDVGCSEGLYSRHLAHRGASVLAIDHSMPFLRRTRQRAQRARVRVAPVRAVAQRLPISDDAVDAAVIGGTLNEIGDAPAALAEVARVLRPGGRMFVMSLVRARTRRGRAAQAIVQPAGIRFWSPGATTEMFELAGLAVEDQRIDGLVARTRLVRKTSR